MAVFDGFAVGPFAFVRGDGFLPNYEVCSGGFFLPLTDSPVGDEYDNSGMMIAIASSISFFV